MSSSKHSFIDLCDSSDENEYARNRPLPPPRRLPPQRDNNRERAAIVLIVSSDDDDSSNGDDGRSSGDATVEIPQYRANRKQQQQTEDINRGEGDDDNPNSSNGRIEFLEKRPAAPKPQYDMRRKSASAQMEESSDFDSSDDDLAIRRHRQRQQQEEWKYFQQSHKKLSSPQQQGGRSIKDAITIDSSDSDDDNDETDVSPVAGKQQINHRSHGDDERKMAPTKSTYWEFLKKQQRKSHSVEETKPRPQIILQSRYATWLRDDPSDKEMEAVEQSNEDGSMGDSDEWETTRSKRPQHKVKTISVATPLETVESRYYMGRGRPSGYTNRDRVWQKGEKAKRKTVPPSTKPLSSQDPNYLNDEDEMLELVTSEDNRPKRKSNNKTFYQEPDQFNPNVDDNILYFNNSNRRKSEVAVPVAFEYKCPAKSSKRQQGRPKKDETTPKQDHFDFDDDDFGDPDTRYMDTVPHLTKIESDINGHPIKYFTAYGLSDDILYDFKITVAQSKIPNSGLGAFLTYLGGRRLKKEVHDRTQEKLENRYTYIPKTMHPLEATHPDGFGVSLKLTGNNLHGNRNSIYWSHTQQPLSAVVPRKLHRVKVKLTGENLHYDSSDDELGLSCCPKRIGFLNRHIESDYVPADDITFSKNSFGCSFLTLGRYGPATRADRKRKIDFDLKTFIFDQEPGAWCFSVPEPLMGAEQFIDITGDDTGEPHEAARRHLAIYVNEVGHDKSLVKNVQALDKDDRTVEYYIDIKQPLHKGDCVELLTDYVARYEPTRERKGYGKKNLGGEIKDDHHEASKLERDFDERTLVIEMIMELPIIELFYTMEFLVTRILPPVTKATQVIDSPGISADTIVPTPRQLVARMRLHWMAPILKKRLQQLKHASLDHVTAGVPAAKSLWCQAMIWLNDFPWAALSRRKLTYPNNALKTTFRREQIQEPLYKLRHRILSPLNETIWCPVAQDLTRVLATNLASFTNTGSRDGQKLLEKLIALGKHAAKIIRLAASHATMVASHLMFASCMAPEEIGRLTKQDLSECDEMTATPKSIIAQKVENRVCQDMMDLAMEPSIDSSVRKCPECVVCSDFGTSVPRCTEAVINGHAKIDEQWYLIWQVIFIVHAFGSEVCEVLAVNSVSSSSAMKLARDQMVATFTDRLCGELKVDNKVAKNALAKKVKGPLLHRSSRASPSKRKIGRIEQQKPTKANKRDGPPKSRSHGQFFDIIMWTCLLKLGWRKEIGGRPTDFHIFPPGVVRGKGFRPRLDYFDSRRQTLEFLKRDKRWKNKAEVVEALRYFELAGKISSGKIPREVVKKDAWVLAEARKQLQKEKEEKKKD